MNFPDLVRAVKRKTGRPMVRVRPVAEAVFEAIQDAIARGEDVSIFGFGRFELREMPDRSVYDFKSGQRVIRSGRRRVWFQPSAKTLKGARGKKKRR